MESEVLRTFVSRGMLKSSHPFKGTISDPELLRDALILAGKLPRNLTFGEMDDQPDDPPMATFDYEEIKKRFKWGNWDIDGSAMHLHVHQVVGEFHSSTGMKSPCTNCSCSLTRLQTHTKCIF